jgi:hypothetical protein
MTISFTDFCMHRNREMANLCNLMNWMKLNINFNPYIWEKQYKNRNSKPVFWPNYVINKKEANCVDIGIFLYFLSEFYHFECELTFMSINSKEKVLDTSATSMLHVIPLVRTTDNNIYIFDYIGNVNSSLVHGPFETFEGACEKISKFYEMIKLSFTDYSGKVYNTEPYLDFHLVKNKDLEVLHKFKNKNISQYELFTHIKDLKEFVDMCYQKQDLSNAGNYIIYVPPKRVIKSIFNTDPLNMFKQMEHAAFCKGKGYLSLFKPKK